MPVHTYAYMYTLNAYMHTHSTPYMYTCTSILHVHKHIGVHTLQNTCKHTYLVLYKINIQVAHYTHTNIAYTALLACTYTCT